MEKWKSHTRRGDRAFTRLELAVVLATLGLLAAITLPVLAGGKSHSEQASCLSNLPADATPTDAQNSSQASFAWIATTGASIKQVTHDRNFGPADVLQVGVDAVLETRDFEHIREIHQALRNAGIEFREESERGRA